MTLRLIRSQFVNSVTSAAGLFEANLLIQHEKDGSEIFYLGVGNNPIQLDSQHDFMAHPAPLSPRQVGQLMGDG